MAGKTFIARRGTTAIPNATIYGTFQGLATSDDGEAQRLSIQALGLLVLLLSRPQGKASMGYRAFLDRGMGKASVMKALRELNNAGLRHQFKRRAVGGGVITDTVLSETYMSREEAEKLWAADGHTHIKKTAQGPEEVPGKDGQEDDQEGAESPVDNPENHNGAEIGATGENGESVMDPHTGALETGASLPRGSAKSLLVHTSQRDQGFQREAEQRPALGVDNGPDDDATSTGPGREKVLEMLAERRAKKAGLPHGPSQPLASTAPGIDRTGSAGASEKNGLAPFDYDAYLAGARL